MNKIRTTVLIVDDDLMLAEMCRQTLVESGYAAVIAQSGQDALEILENQGIDIVLSDVNMPGMSGMDLLRHIPRAAGPDVVLMTGHGSVPAAVEAMRLGARDYILKPFIDDELLLSIERTAEMRRLQTENRMLRLRLSPDTIFGMVGNSAGMLRLGEAILRVAGRRQPVLITGETGTGKELVARAIHQHAPEKDGPFIAVDCGALSEGMVESELFGHVRGAFTSALGHRPGLLAAAAKGMLFLDEIGELPLALQAKLFRVLQEHEFRPLGADAVRPFTGRIVAATNKNLEAEIDDGRFRQELYFRLAVHRLHVPPLRSRKDDIPVLIEHFIDKHGEGKVLAISPDALSLLVEFPWPGNIRELENCIIGMCASCEGRVLEAEHVPQALRKAVNAGPKPGNPLEAAERATIAGILKSTGGNVAEAARQLGIAKATLYRKIKLHALAD